MTVIPSSIVCTVPIQPHKTSYKLKKPKFSLTFNLAIPVAHESKRRYGLYKPQRQIPFLSLSLLHSSILIEYNCLAGVNSLICTRH